MDVVVCTYDGRRNHPGGRALQGPVVRVALTDLDPARGGPATVTQLVAATGQSQPLVSQHLKTLRLANVVTVDRVGREATYAVADTHVTHVVEDAISHVLEDSR